jgi:hypothetical protein
MCTPIPRKVTKPFTLIHLVNARVHMGKVAQDKLNVSRLKRTPQPPDNQDIAQSSFFFSLDLKPRLNAEDITGKTNYTKLWIKV